MKKYKRGIALLLASLIVFSAVSVYASDNPEYKFSKAYDDVEYKIRDLLFNHKSDYNSPDAWTGGEGWNGGWYTAVGRPYGDKPSVSDYWDVGYLHNYYANVSLNRKLCTQIDTKTDGEYYLLFKFFDSGSLDLTKTNDKIGFGNSAEPGSEPVVYCGLNYSKAENVYHFQLGKRGNVISGDKRYEYNDIAGKESGKIWQFKFNIKVNAQGEDVIRMKTWQLRNTEPADWLLSMPCELENQNLDMIDVRNNGTGLGIGNIIIEGAQGAGISAISDIFSRIENKENVTKEDAEKALHFIRNMPADNEIMLKSLYTDLLYPYITKNGWEDIVTSRLTESTIMQDNPVNADDAKIFTLTFSDALDSSSMPVLKKAVGEEVETVINIENNIITIEVVKGLEPLSEYIVDLSGIKNTLGVNVSPLEVKFSTSAVPLLNLKDGAQYGEGTKILWTDLPGVTTEAELDGKPLKNGEKIFGVGEHSVTVRAIHEAKTESRTISIIILEAFAPKASDVAVSGKAETGEVVTGSYVFSDKNNDKEGKSIYKWYRSETETGEYKLIEGADKKEYILTEQDENSYLQFEVTPVSESEYASVGESIKSGAFKGAFRPVAKNVKLSGNVKSGETLTLLYDYSDENGDEAQTPDIKWYMSDKKDGEYTVLENKTDDKLVIDETHFEKYIRAGIVVKSSKKPYNGAEQYTEPIAAPFKPVVKNVTIKGVARAGESLSAEYEFYDINGDEESGSIITWVDESNGKTIKNGPVLDLTDAMVDKRIVLKVVGMSNNEPKASDAVESKSVKISARRSSGGGGGGGGGGSHISGYGSGSKIPEKPQEIKKPEPQKPEKAKYFDDMKNHWAKDAVIALADAGIVVGTSENTYEPERPVTRAELVTMLMRTSKGTAGEYEPVFEDVSETDWFCGAIMWAYKQGIISADELFRPYDNVTRQEAAKILSYAADKTKTAELTYSDTDEISGWALEYVGYVYANKIMTGDNENCFNPKNAITRAEAAMAIYRIPDRK